MLRRIRFSWTGSVNGEVSSRMMNMTVSVNKKYCYLRRYVSDDVRRKIREENRKTRERFHASEKQWEKLVNRSLLHPEDLEIYEAHRVAVAHGHFTYNDPRTGNRVMTRLRHFLRGSCCGNACRHCVYNHDNVAEKDKSQRVYNSAFWVSIDERPDLRKVTPSGYSVNMREVGKTEELDFEFQNQSYNEDGDDNIDPLLFKH